MARDLEPPALRAADLEQFRRDGFLQVPGVLSREQCAGLVEVTRGYLPPAFRSDDQRAWKGRIQDCCNNIPLYQRKGLVRFKAGDGFASHPEMTDAVYANPRVRGLFETFLGADLEKLRVRGLNPNFPFPRWVSLNELVGARLDPDLRGGPWDRIRLPAPPQFPITGHLETHAVELGALVYLSDVGPEAGGLGVWPGSHRLFELAFGSSVDFLPNRLYKRLFRLLQGRRPRVLEGRAGDLILFHNRLLHTNTFNRSSAVRHALVIDGLGRGWRERAAEPRMSEDELNALGLTRHIAHSPVVRDVLAPLARDPLGALAAKRPKLAGFIQALSKDPSGAGRNHLSARIRMRRDGDLWIVVSQTGEHRKSYKLDAYGLARHGAYRARLNGEALARSRCGILVEQVEPLAGPWSLELEGRFERDHYVRVIRTRQPFTQSDLLHVGVVAAGARRYAAAFEV